MSFTGTYEFAIDAKNRIAIPADIRDQVRGDFKSAGQPETVTWVVTLGQGKTLCLYTLEDFEKLADRLNESELDPQEVLEYERMLFSLSRRCEMDGQGRVRLPDHLKRMSGLESDVVLIGAKDHLEIRDRSTWQGEVDTFIKEKMHILVNPRLMLRKRTQE